MNIRDLMVLKGGKIVLITDEPSNAIKKAGCDALAADLAAKYALAVEGKLHAEPTMDDLEAKIDDLVAKFDVMAEAIGDDQ